MATKKEIQRAARPSKSGAASARAAEKAWLATLAERVRASVPTETPKQSYAERQTRKPAHKERAEREAERIRWEARKHKRTRKTKVPAGLAPLKPYPHEPPGRLLLVSSEQRRRYAGKAARLSWEVFLLDLLTSSVAWRTQLANGGASCLPEYRWSVTAEAEGIWSALLNSGAPVWLTPSVIAWLLEHFSVQGGGGRCGKMTPTKIRKLLREPTALSARIYGLE